jgi:hypothetical protein
MCASFDHQRDSTGLASYAQQRNLYTTVASGSYTLIAA